MTRLIKAGNRLFATFIIAMAALGATAPVVAQEGPKAQEQVVVERKVNINKADAATIAAVLTGIGASKAEAIVAYREMHGAFSSIEELREVKGIGAATLEQNRGRITLE